MSPKLGWAPENLDSLVVAIEEDDIVLLQTAIKNTERRYPYKDGK